MLCPCKQLFCEILQEKPAQSKLPIGLVAQFLSPNYAVLKLQKFSTTSSYPTIAIYNHLTRWPTIQILHPFIFVCICAIFVYNLLSCDESTNWYSQNVSIVSFTLVHDSLIARPPAASFSFLPFPQQPWAFQHFIAGSAIGTSRYFYSSSIHSSIPLFLSLSHPITLRSIHHLRTTGTLKPCATAWKKAPNTLAASKSPSTPPSPTQTASNSTTSTWT